MILLVLESTFNRHEILNYSPVKNLISFASMAIYRQAKLLVYVHLCSVAGSTTRNQQLSDPFSAFQSETLHMLDLQVHKYEAFAEPQFIVNY